MEEVRTPQRVAAGKEKALPRSCVLVLNPRKMASRKAKKRPVTLGLKEEMKHQRGVDNLRPRRPPLRPRRQERIGRAVV